MSELEVLGRLGVSLAIGLLIGLERGWRRRSAGEGRRAAGLRTLGLTGLLGGVVASTTGGAADALLAGAFLSLALVLGVFQLLEARRTRDASATGVIAGLLAFALGAYAARGSLLVAVGGAVAATALLAFKRPLHAWVRALSWAELRALLVLLVMTALILPVLPDRTFDPWQALNPRRIWLLAVLIAGVSFLGYAAVRIAGARGGLLLSALAGGLASSTATTLSFARLVRSNPALCTWLAGGSLISSGLMALRVLVLAGAINRPFALALAWPMGAFALVLGAAGALLMTRRPAGAEPQTITTLTNPLELASALKFAGLIAVIMLLGKVLSRAFGAMGVYGLAALSGVADVDALTLSVSELAGRDLAASAAVLAVSLAVASNTLSKAVIAAVVGGRKHGLLMGGASLAAVAAAALILVLRI
ncbi:DUF4010 domain-containing protein [Brevundimonas mediterranea]|uniref:DUF4010 domain-containing protein n=1 Tax=Brevundimonas mediterranea TaxID=74329 RepID=UPI001605D213